MDYAYASRIDHFEEWTRTHCVQSVDQFAGEPLALEPWQVEFMGEVLAVERDETPYWSVGVLVLPRKNGKTTLLGAYADYHLDESEGGPEILLTASSDKQAGRLFDSVVSFTRRSAYLSSRVHIRDHIGEIARADGLGKIIRMSSDPNRAHGYNPSRVVADELHAWTTPGLRKFWAAMTTAGGARRDTQVLVISTAGEAEEREEGILGRLVDENERRGDVERRQALTISRNHAARVLVYRYEAPVDPDASMSDQRADAAAIRAANPASFITDEYLERQAADPGISDPEFLQLHGCVWAAGRGMWLADRWDALRSDEALDTESGIAIGVDVGLTDDSTAVTWCGKTEDGRVAFRSKVWAARRDVSAHVYVPGGRVRLEPVEDFVLELAGRHPVTSVVYDPRFFEQSAQRLSDRGVNVVALEQQGKAWDDATNAFYRSALADETTHDGDTVLASHVKSTVAEQTERGWKLRKLKSGRKIDALVAAVLAFAGYELDLGGGGIEFFTLDDLLRDD